MEKYSGKKDLFDFLIKLLWWFCLEARVTSYEKQETWVLSVPIVTLLPILFSDLLRRHPNVMWLRHRHTTVQIKSLRSGGKSAYLKCTSTVCQPILVLLFRCESAREPLENIPHHYTIHFNNVVIRDPVGSYDSITDYVIYYCDTYFSFNYTNPSILT